MGKRWSQKEIDYLRKYYPSYNKEKLLNLLDGRTWRAISDKAQRLGIKCKRSTRKALWRRFDEASRKERQKMVSWYWKVMVETPEGSEWWFGSSDMSHKAIRADFLDVANDVLARQEEPGCPGLAAKWEAIRDALLNPDTKLKWWRQISHDKRWIRIRNSFHGSKEWGEFRRRWLEKHPACARCGRTDSVLQVHHTGPYTLDRTVLDEGFLEGLRHPDRLETLCRDCHKNEHGVLILVEKDFLKNK